MDNNDKLKQAYTRQDQLDSKFILNRLPSVIRRLQTENNIGGSFYFPLKGSMKKFQKEEFPEGSSIDLGNIQRMKRIFFDFSTPLSEVTLNNVKSFKSQKFLPGKLNLFAGKNSTGKSTILESIALLTNWAHTKNIVYEGIAFKQIFGIKNLNEFKSTFAKKEENISIELKATQLHNKKFDVGDATISFLINNKIDQDSNKLKYAPIKALRIITNNSTIFKEAEARNLPYYDGSSKEEPYKPKHDSIVPVHTEIQYIFDNDKLEKLQKGLDFGINAMYEHVKKIGGIKKLKDNKEQEIEDQKKRRTLRTNKEQRERDQENLIITFYSDKKKLKPDKKDINTMLSNYVDISISRIKENTTPTRLYGSSFSPGEKQFQEASKNYQTLADYYLPIGQDQLIRWLAFDYIDFKSEKFVLDDQDSDLLALKDINELIHSTEKVDNFVKMINKQFTKDNSKKKIKLDKPPDRVLSNLISETLAGLTMDYLESLGLKHEAGININNELSYLGIFDATGNFDTNKLDSKSTAPFTKGLESTTLNDLFSWMLEGGASLNKLKKNKEQIEKNYKKDLDGLLSEHEKKQAFIDLQIKYMELFDNSLRVLECVGQTIEAISSKTTNTGTEINKMYKKIDEIMDKKSLHFIENWSEIKYKLLENLSKYYIQEVPLDSQEKIVLVPFKDDFININPLIEFNSPNMDTTGTFKNINTSLAASFESLFSTTFVGPLRERTDFKDEIFSFEYPLTLGLKGEKIVSFLSTFSDKKVLFPIPEIIEDIDKDNYQHENIQKKYLKEDTYINHLSLWLKYLELAEKIVDFDESGQIKVLQESKQKENSKSELTLENIGVGVSQVLPVLLSCMVSQNEFQHNELLLLEQPELHLHPYAQAKLADFFIAVSMTDTKTLFVETHSEHILNRLRLRKIQLQKAEDFIKIFFSKKSKEGKTSLDEFTINPDGSYDFDEYPEGFFDQTQLESRDIAKAVIKSKKEN